MELCRWISDEPCLSLSGEQPGPTLVQMPADVIIHICGWLSTRDILALRMSSKSIARVTHNSAIWFSFLRKLIIPLPLLPATSKYAFGEIGPGTYEWLMLRALYLEQNWQRHNPVAAHSRFEAFDRTVAIKLLPGGKYMVSVAKNMASGQHALVLWDLNHKGRRVALTGYVEQDPLMRLEARYGVVNNYPSIFIAYSTPSVRTDQGLAARITVLSVPIALLEELVVHEPDSPLFGHYTQTMEHPFTLMHQSITFDEVAQLALGDFESEMVLLVVHRPRALVFYYLSSGQCGNLILGPITQHSDYLHSIWTVKLLTGQNSVLVSRVLIQPGTAFESTVFTLDIFHLPGPNETLDNPPCYSRQLIEGLIIDNFYFSDLETSWFDSLRDPEGLIPAPIHTEPPPISVFATTRQPRGFVHWILRPTRLPTAPLQLPYNRGTIGRFIYAFPLMKLERNTWGDAVARPVILVGAYRSLVALRPHVHNKLQQAGKVDQGVEVMWFCTHATAGVRYRQYATPRTTGNRRGAAAGGKRERAEESVAVQREKALGLRERTLRVPAVPREIAREMREGTTAMAWDESTGMMCVATVADTGIHVLDFGGETWEVGVVQT